jgi:hypothetical protein
MPGLNHVTESLVMSSEKDEAASPSKETHVSEPLGSKSPDNMKSLSFVPLGLSVRLQISRGKHVIPYCKE